jgi:D-arginine dehydrogenase
MAGLSMSVVQEVDFAVVGAGIAGASAAAFLARRGRVLLLEAEAQPGYHATGRSAALFSEIYGNPVIRALTRASRGFLFDAPDGFAGAPLVSPRPTMYFGTPAQRAAIERFRAAPGIAAATTLLSAAEAFAQAPIFRAGYLGGAALETGSADIDVHGLHQGFLRAGRAAGAVLRNDCRVAHVERSGGAWLLHTREGTVRAPVVVNAAGAWGDEFARAAGVAPIGLQPKRRTAALVKVPEGVRAERWPASIDIDEQFYFKPDAGLLLLSPADETDTPPCDAQPEDLDVAIAVDRFEQATGTTVRQVSHRWAGLRVFTADRTPVVGFDPHAEGFFWLVGQGGYGIQTSPALGRLAAALAGGAAVPADLVDGGIDAAMLSPGRFMPPR